MSALPAEGALPTPAIGAAITGVGAGKGITGKGATIWVGSDRRLGGDAAPSRRLLGRWWGFSCSRGGGGGSGPTSKSCSACSGDAPLPSASPRTSA
jgi:hypothetical protein